MMKKKIIIIFIITLIILSLLNLIFSQLNNNSWNLSGNWKFDGVSLFGINLNGVLGALFSTLLDLNIRNIDGEIKLIINDQNNDERVSNISIKLDHSSGKVGFSFSFPMPNGKWKNISYNFSLNGDYNTSKFAKPEDYYNKTIRDLLNDLLLKGINITMVGEKSNVTINKGPNFSISNPVYNIKYERNIIYEESKDPFITDNNQNNNQITNIINNQSSNIPNNKSDNNYSVSYNQTSKSDLPFNLSYNPKNSRILLYTGESKKFTIEDIGYDSIKWYLDNKEVGNSDEYEFKENIAGTHKLKVEVKKISKMKSYTWSIIVEKKEISKEFSFFWIYLIFFIVIVITGICVFFILKKKNNNEQPFDNKTNNNEKIN